MTHLESEPRAAGAKASSEAQMETVQAPGRMSPEGLLVLALDTSTPVLAAALVRGDAVLACIQSPAERNHSAHVVPAVQQLLRDASVLPAQLDGIAAGVGPGSYTGVRIAVSVAKTLAWAWKLPIAGVSTLEALAVGAWREYAGKEGTEALIGRPSSPPPGSASLQSQAATGSSNAAAADGIASPAPPHADVWAVPLIDARRGQAYTALFAAGPEGWSRLEGDAIRLVSDWTRVLYERIEAAKVSERPSCLLFTGDLEKHEEGISMLESLLAGLSGAGPVVARQPHVMDGRSVAWLGSRRLAGGEADDAHAFVPNYTQLAEAEAKLLEKPGEA
jgi:tRNA threonylcarbamoyladenosine biosynthesis protein TsaB